MSTPAQQPVTPQRLTQMSWGYAAPLIIDAALSQHLFDHLDSGPKTAEELAGAAGVPLRGVRIVANALTGLQLLSKDSAGRYTMAPDTAKFLVSTQPSFLGPIVHHTATQILPIWMKLPEVLAAGKPPSGVNNQQVGAAFFAEFVESLFPLGYPAAQTLAAALGIAQAQQPVKALDLAAGSGVWSIALAQASPEVKVTVVDWPGVLDVTRKMTARFQVADRFTFVPGDLLETDFGSGYNIATLGHILHSEGEQRSRQLLAKTFQALAPGGTIAIQEFLVDDERASNALGLIFAVNMLVATENGDTFSFNEIAGWLREAGFENPRTLESPGPSPLILAKKPA